MTVETLFEAMFSTPSKNWPKIKNGPKYEKNKEIRSFLYWHLK